VGDILLHIELREPEQAHQTLARHAWPWVKEQLRQGRALVADFRLYEDDITEKQRGYYHAVVLTEIAAFARPNGVQFPMKVWKEHFRKTFLGHKVVSAVNPMTGRKSRRRVRISTEDLGIAGYAELIDKVIAFAATDLGVQVSEPLPPELRPRRRQRKNETIDNETGEIMEVTA
jgi:hypothetical protein